MLPWREPVRHVGTGTCALSASVAKDLAADVGIRLDRNVLPRSVSRNIWREIPPCTRLQSVLISHVGGELFA
jgi:hypothetical protein